MATIQVLAPVPVDKAYSYAMPDHMELQPGSYVTIPLGKREVTGIVWNTETEKEAPPNLKSVAGQYDLPPLPALHRDFIARIAKYTMTPLGSVLKMTLSAASALEPETPLTGYVPTALSAANKKGLSPKQKKVLEILNTGHPQRAAEIARAAGCTAGVIKTMAKKGLLRTQDLYPSPPCTDPGPDHKGVDLSRAQQDVAQKLVSHVRAEKYTASLLDGVTGAGKTEVYFEAVAETLRKDRQVLILLPEIALTGMFIDRFERRFGCKPALWHSSLTPAQRRRTWRGVAMGETKVIVGARSALFLPYPDLGLIVVDEEHDPAYKQEDGALYHARDMAVLRAHLGQIPITLVSATPSLETIENVHAGKYDHLQLPDRYGGARLPGISLIDLRKDKPERQHFIAPSLKKELAENLAKGEQSLLFLNRRGYAPLTLCRSCGHRVSCPRCTAWLVEHKRTNRFHCHHCGFTSEIPDHCPSCKDKDSFAACGPGVERILEEIKSYFPDARTVVLASDTAEDKETIRTELQKIINHEYDIIIGTQIIAKGHHFPDLTLVGVIDADLGLRGGELRAAERTWQLLHQVAGRAGREEKPGRVFLQSFIPDNPVMKALAAHDRDGFLAAEAESRKAAHMPPFSRLAGIIISGKNEKQVADAAIALGRIAPQALGLSVLGPAEAPFYRLRGQYRRRLLVQADRTIDVQKAINVWLEQVKTPSTVRVQVDIDPQTFL